ncbi:MAG: superoxide dismutase [Rikenellaceae bacterium]
MKEKFQLPKLDYSVQSLIPKISVLTMDCHYNRHYAGYIDTLNRLIEGTRFASLTLKEIVRESSGKILNNAGQVLNHELYFDSLTPNQRKLEPDGALLEAIELSFGSFGGMKEQLAAASIALFGSGWVFLTVVGKELEITSCSNGDTPVREGKEVILTIDVWEHAYYLDQKNRRDRYIKNLWGVIDWEKVQARYECIIHKNAINQR